ncbi:M14 family metallopeptidase [Chitinophaga horti]|uniref:M14 family metallopeptidase n=1 Tax=Chitinophaga horti TaxID=2920382 RepID=A0ABY6IZJ4_9BACT|nr:M14 family metallopeptidase [Chitinophaga horti]UYQ91822.1 M14 family metallopeptidase [Chitinophaga horti]
MKQLTAFLCCLTTLAASAQDLTTKFERTNARETVTYEECIDYYKLLDKRFTQIKLQEIGASDAGFPLHLATYSDDGDFNYASLRKKNKRIILINNGIHPGEPDGIDATMMLLRDLALGKKKLPSNIVLAVIPLYNIGGALNRSPYYRVDQDGPAEFGSRGNAQNLDLNRDFIKVDSRNARTFQQIYHLTDPDVFIDNHVSNGADYQHIMTLLCTQHDKLGGPMGEFMSKTFEPGLYQLMKEKGYDLIPYVNHFGNTPDSGWVEFHDGPRYSSGYTTLFHTFGFVPETHMLKPYDQRVKATYALMESFIAFTSEHGETIKALRAQSKAAVKTQKTFPLEWTADMTKFSNRLFKGYTPGYKPSAISGLPRLYYDKTKPYERQIKFYNYFKAGNIVTKPDAYIIPQGWWKVTDLLKNNQVKMERLKRDTTMVVEAYHIEDYKTAARPYEQHYIHNSIKVSLKKHTLHFRKGDYLIPMNQEANRYLIETLEPTGGDSFLAWNFFDAVLGQKEWYSTYVFEDTGYEYLKQHPELQEKLAQQRTQDTTFAKSADAQLNFVFKNSPYFEPDFNRYPVYRIFYK